VIAMPMDPDLRAMLDAVSREHDRLMARDREPVRSVPVQRDGLAGLRYKDHEENAPAPAPIVGTIYRDVDDPRRTYALRDLDEENEKNAADWNRWFDSCLALRLDPHLEEIDGVFDSALRRVEYIEDTFSRRIADLRAENAELRGMLGSVLAKFDALRASTEAIERERQVEKRELVVRNQVIAERSDRIANLQRENAASHAELAAQRLDAAFGQRDQRLEMLEEKLGMLLRFLSVSGLDLPRGI